MSHCPSNTGLQDKPKRQIFHINISEWKLDLCLFFFFQSDFLHAPTMPVQVCMCIVTCVHTHVHVYVHTHIRACASVYVYNHVCTHACASVLVYIHVCARACASVYVYSHVCTHVCASVHVSIHTLTHVCLSLGTRRPPHVIPHVPFTFWNTSYSPG